MNLISGIGVNLNPAQNHDVSRHAATTVPPKGNSESPEMPKQINSNNTSVQFVFYGERNERIAIRVEDRESGKVIREFPAKEVQRLYSELKKLSGMMFHEKA